MKKFIILIAIVLFVFSVGAFGTLVGCVAQGIDPNTISCRCNIDCTAKMHDKENVSIQDLSSENTGLIRFEKNQEKMWKVKLCSHLQSAPNLHVDNLGTTLISRIS